MHLWGYYIYEYDVGRIDRKILAKHCEYIESLGRNTLKRRQVYTSFSRNARNTTRRHGGWREKTGMELRCTRHDACVCNTLQLFSWTNLLSVHRTARQSTFTGCKILFSVINPQRNWALRANVSVFFYGRDVKNILSEKMKSLFDLLIIFFNLFLYFIVVICRYICNYIVYFTARITWEIILLHTL